MIAIVTGATRGVGLAVANSLASRGYNLALGARSQADLDRVAKDIREEHHVDVFVKSVDFSIKDEVVGFCSEIDKLKDDVRIIVNNLGIYGGDELSKEEDGLLEKMLQTNLMSAYYLTRYFLDGMKVAKKGFIFNICSIVSKIPRPDVASYTISKIALDAFSKVLAQEMKQYNVKVTSIIPGSINTSSWDGMDVPRNEFVQPEDIANAIRNVLEMSKGAQVEEVVIRPVNPNF